MKYTLRNLSQDEMRNIVGVNDANIALLEQLYGCGIVYRDDYFKLLCDDEEIFSRFSRQMDYIVRKCKDNISDRDFITHSFMQTSDDEKEDFADIVNISVLVKSERCEEFRKTITDISNGQIELSETAKLEADFA